MEGVASNSFYIINLYKEISHELCFEVEEKREGAHVLEIKNYHAVSMLKHLCVIDFNCLTVIISYI